MMKPNCGTSVLIRHILFRSDKQWKQRNKSNNFKLDLSSDACSDIFGLYDFWNVDRPLWPSFLHSSNVEKILKSEDCYRCNAGIKPRKLWFTKKFLKGSQRPKILNHKPHFSKQTWKSRKQIEMEQDFIKVVDVKET